MNLNDRGPGNLAPKSKKTRKTLSEIFKKGFSDGSIPHPRNKAIFVYTIEGEYIDTYISGKEASKALNVYRRSILRTANGEYKQMKGYQFSFILKQMPNLTNHKKGNYKKHKLVPSIVVI